jgi:hypothetical protein
VAVEGAAGDELTDGPLAAVGGLGVVEHRAAPAPVVDAHATGGVDGLGADVEAEHHGVVLERLPHRVPYGVLPRRALDRRSDREEAELEPHLAGPPDLGHAVVGVEERQRRGHDVAR